MSATITKASDQMNSKWQEIGGWKGIGDQFESSVNAAGKGWKDIDGKADLSGKANSVNEAAARQGKKFDERYGLMKQLRQGVDRISGKAKNSPAPQVAAPASQPAAPQSADLQPAVPPTTEQGPGAMSIGYKVNESINIGAPYPAPAASSALVLATGQQITYLSRTAQKPYPGQVVSVTSDAIQIKLDGVADLKTVGPDEFWRISSSSSDRNSGASGSKFTVFTTGQSVLYQSRSTGETYSGTVAGPAASGGVQLKLHGVQNAKEVPASDLWRIQTTAKTPPYDLGIQSSLSQTSQKIPTTSAKLAQVPYEMPTTSKVATYDLGIQSSLVQTSQKIATTSGNVAQTSSKMPSTSTSEGAYKMPDASIIHLE